MGGRDGGDPEEEEEEEDGAALKRPGESGSAGRVPAPRISETSVSVGSAPDTLLGDEEAVVSGLGDVEVAAAVAAAAAAFDEPSSVGGGGSTALPWRRNEAL